MPSMHRTHRLLWMRCSRHGPLALGSVGTSPPGELPVARVSKALQANLGVCAPAASTATKLQHLIRSDRGPPMFHNLLTELKRVLAEATLESLSGTKEGSWFLCYGPYTHQRGAPPMVWRHANLKGGREGISSEKRRRRVAQARGGTGGRVPHFPRLDALSLSLSLCFGARALPPPPRFRAAVGVDLH